MLLNSHDFRKKEISAWNNNNLKDSGLLMHQIHVYPAKFPSFLVKKAINYVENKRDATVNVIGDIFCGCGTTALEARLYGKHFWGCDINPVATLISKTKRQHYKIDTLDKYREQIFKSYEIKQPPSNFFLDNERINFWFSKEIIFELYNLRRVIRATVPSGKYQDFFLVAFSNILKRVSRWLTKSIKPTIDKTKKQQSVISVFRSQLNQMFKAVMQTTNKIDPSVTSKIENKNFLTMKNREPFLDLLITSPPYVTSYEYADLHQLSTLWLDYVKDYRDLRNGTIGSTYSIKIANEKKSLLNKVGQNIYDDLLKTNAKNKISVLKYFLDMKLTVEKSYSIIKENGYAIFIIGNTKLKNVYIDNAKYLAQCMIDSGFEKPEIKKRRVDSKILTPFRDMNGKFSSDKRKRKIYSYEYILIGKK